MVQKQKGAQQGRSDFFFHPPSIARLLATLGLKLKKSRRPLTLSKVQNCLENVSSFNGSTQKKNACGAKHSIRYASATRPLFARAMEHPVFLTCLPGCPGLIISTAR
jgi:hypothetical protein